MSLEKKSGGATRGRGRFKASWKWMPGNVLDSLVCASLGEGEKEKEKKKREVMRSGRDWPDYVFFSGTQGPKARRRRSEWAVGAAATPIRQVLRLRGCWR